MAARRRRNGDNGLDAWPGYVDALSTLLMVIIFVLLVFVLAQAFLSATLSGRNQALEEMRKELSDMRASLVRERGRATDLTNTAADLERQFAQADTARRSLNRQLEDLRNLTSQLTADRDRLTLQSADAGLALEAASLANDRMRLTLAQAMERAEQAAKDRDAARDARLEAERRMQQALRDADSARQASQTAETASRTAERTAEAAIAERDRARADQAAAVVAATQADQEKAAALAGLATARTEAEAALRERDKARADQAAALARAAAALQAEEAVRARLAEMERQIAALDRTVRADKATIEAKLSELAELARQAKALADLRDALRRQIQEADARLATEAEGRKTAETALTREADTVLQARAEIAALRRELETQRAEMARIAAALDLSQRDVQTKQAEVTDLDRRLNAALASRIEQLQQYRSEFFGRLRTLLESRTGIQVVGDRFVFQSEVLFPVGSAEMTPAGIGQMTTLAITIKQIAAEIPREVSWVLRVDGHTDRTPVRGGQFGSNWELSAARAINVVKFLISLGVPAERLAATAFGEFQPLAQGDSPDSLARDRRIELRLTDR